MQYLKLVNAKKIKLYFLTKPKEKEGSIMNFKYLCEGTVKPTTNKGLRALVRKMIEKRGPNCNLNWIDVSGITDFTNVFRETEFNGDISKWDVSNGKNFDAMFLYSEFNGDVSKWDMSSATSLASMFESSPFNGDVSRWDVSNVVNFSSMFESSKFNGDVSKWNVSKGERFKAMFAYSPFNGDVSKWDVNERGKPVYLWGMFMKSKFSGNIDDWPVGNIASASFEDIFKGCPNDKPGKWPVWTYADYN